MVESVICCSMAPSNDEAKPIWPNRKIEKAKPRFQRIAADLKVATVLLVGFIDCTLTRVVSKVHLADLGGCKPLPHFDFLFIWMTTILRDTHSFHTILIRLKLDPPLQQK